MEKIIILPENLHLGPDTSLKLKLLELFNKKNVSCFKMILVSDSKTKSVQQIKVKKTAVFKKKILKIGGKKKKLANSFKCHTPVKA